METLTVLKGEKASAFMSCIVLEMCRDVECELVLLVLSCIQLSFKMKTVALSNFSAELQVVRINLAGLIILIHICCEFTSIAMSIVV